MSKTFQTVSTIIVAILTIFMILFTAMGIFEIFDSTRSYTISEDSFIYALEEGRYSSLVEYYHRNAAAGAKMTETMKECYAVARYYEAAIDYQLAVQDKDPALQEKYKALMDTAAGEMGDLSYARKEIDTLF